MLSVPKVTRSRFLVSYSQNWYSLVVSMAAAIIKIIMVIYLKRFTFYLVTLIRKYEINTIFKTIMYAPYK